MKLRARTDRNHQEVKDALKRVGFVVLDCSRFGDGWPDLLCIRRGQIVFAEVKDGRKPPSKRALTNDEVEFRNLVERAGGCYRVVLSAEEAAQL